MFAVVFTGINFNRECEDEEEGEKSQQKLWSMTSTKKSSNKRDAAPFSNGMGRHSFFRSRKLQRVSFA